mmetsp:Transcript_19905/g.32751  ORF Transcript_19905/g.32751 Transcript_19905/m.32751 type:complete len:458 (+) Transcript_19905:337-1710(+)|eukprot:CAMPEP_0203746688 /NCGR_PEP_ID=MMETSP0098-20131031/2057_1 /ASSEMBLY_ACC=CAM_ASM_000208 /TAXON_ID=96639 /ORGANISM=" , Strain NY0313808BC1" /LENGTH=457 /DNA_ID=CAMNT_0050634875 /DNA_START=325 /DNA_END=1698 /DNA_ORIENTATION=+
MNSPSGKRRLSREQINPSNLIMSQENAELIRQVIPKVMEQLQRDRENVEATGGHEDMVKIANQSEKYLIELQQWSSRAEDLLEQQEHERTSSTQNNVLMDESSDESETEESSGRPVMSQATRGRFMLSLKRNQQSRECEGLFDFSTGMFFMFERVIRNTIYGNVLRAQGGSRAQDGRQVELTGEQYAIKVFQKSLVSAKRARGGQPVQEDPLREISLQQRLSDPGNSNVLRLMGCFEDSDYIYTILPLVGMELFDLISSNGPFTEKKSRQIFQEMLSAVQYIHSRGVSHRDISPENFLMDVETTSHPILIDFGLAYEMKKIRHPMRTHTSEEMLQARPSDYEPIPHTGFVGKLLYAAPEMWSNRPYDGCSVDVWSTLVTLFVMLFQAPPWERARVSRKRDGYVSIVLQNNLRAVLRTWQFKASDNLIDMMQKVFREDPSYRLNLESILQHPWMNMNE